jgi:hypothetical protein
MAICRGNIVGRVMPLPQATKNSHPTSTRDCCTGHLAGRAEGKGQCVDSGVLFNRRDL